MADGAVNFLLEKLTTILLQSASLLGDARDEIEDMKLELESMKSFLRDAERRKARSESVETWVRQVREVAIEAENIVDEFMHYKQIQKAGKGVEDYFHNLINHLKNTSRHQTSSKLSRIKAKVHQVSERRKRYDFDANLDEGRSIVVPADWWQHHGESSIFDEDELVGMDENRARLSLWLDKDEPRSKIVSIVGMGGLGKTTLVSRVYNDQILKRNFDCWAWISVSRMHGIEDLLRSMVRELLRDNQPAIPGNLAQMNYRQLMEMLIEFLRCRRYLVVLDDVWNIDLWSRIRGAFSDNTSRSRIIFTTRNKNVATSVGRGSRVHHLEPLEETDAWALFCKKAFWSEPDHRCPTELEALARVILRKCEGLPLAIVAIGGLMCSRNKSVGEWKKVQDSLNWQLSYNPMLERIKGILLLSFNDLPFYLKYCFLYCCVFHDGYRIKRKKLIRLWIAEGFIVERKGITVEEVAEDYLSELILRSMIQVIEISDTGRVKTLRVHDVMRELAMTASETEDFCTTYDAREPRIDRNIQRLSVYNRGEKIQLSRHTLRHLRSLFVFETDICPPFSLNSISSNLKMIRVLDLQGVFLEKIPDALTELFNLRYLNLRKTRIKALPKSMGMLKNLQTLDIRQTYVEKLPRGMMSLEKLRHLFISSYYDNSSKTLDSLHGLHVPVGIGNLQNLQSLACIEAEEQIIQQLGYLTELKRLDITLLRTADGPKLCSSVQKMTSLRRLSVAARNGQELELENLHLTPPFLQKLELIGRLNKLPHWLGSLANISHLHLSSSQLQEDMLRYLEKLPSLVFLELNKAFTGKLLHFRGGAFCNLNKLSLQELRQLDTVQIDQGALPRLRELHLIRCQMLKLLPQGTELLSSLQNLQLEEMPEEFIRRVRRDSGEDRSKVAHITTMNHIFLRGETRGVEAL